jgi:hypothetical protein
LLLFLANFVAILLVALGLFSLAGLTDSAKKRTFSERIRRLWPAVAGFVVIAAVLTHSLLRIIDERHTQFAIESVLLEELATDVAALDDFQHEEHESQHQVLATVRASEIVSPHRVSQIQQALAERLDEPVMLLVRTIVSKDVAATGSAFKAVRVDPDGVFLGHTLSPLELKQRWAEQVLLEEFQSKAGVDLRRATYSEPEGTPLVFAEIRTIRRLSSDEITAVKTRLRERLSQPDLEFAVRFTKEELASEFGRLLVEWTDSSAATPQQRQVMTGLRELIRDEVGRLPEVVPLGVHFHVQEDLWRVLVEVVGPRPVTRDELAALQQKAAEYASEPIELSVWYKAETVITADGFSSFEDFTRATLQKRIETLPKILGRVAQH